MKDYVIKYFKTRKKKKSLGNFNLCFSEQNMGAQKENLSEKETQVKAKDFAKFFVLTFLHSASSNTGRP